MVDQAEGGPETISVQKPKKTKKFFFAGAGLILVILAVVGGIFLFSPGLVSKEVAKTGQTDGPQEPEKGIHGHIYSLEPFLVNLADSDVPRYLKIRIDLETIAKKPSEEYVKRLPQLRDAILTVLSSKKYLEIFDSEGKKKLKEEIVTKLNQALNQFKVKTIYFTEFVVQ